MLLADIISISAGPDKLLHLGFCGRCQKKRGEEHTGMNSVLSRHFSNVRLCVRSAQVAALIHCLESRTFAEHSKNARKRSNANAIGFFHRHFLKSIEIMRYILVKPGITRIRISGGFGFTLKSVFSQQRG